MWASGRLGPPLIRLWFALPTRWSQIGFDLLGTTQACNNVNEKGRWPSECCWKRQGTCKTTWINQTEHYHGEAIEQQEIGGGARLMGVLKFGSAKILQRLRGESTGLMMIFLDFEALTLCAHHWRDCKETHCEAKTSRGERTHFKDLQTKTPSKRDAILNFYELLVLLSI